MTTYIRRALATAAAVSACALVLAPVAQARPTCHSAGVQTRCETNGSTSIKVRPGTTAPPANQPVLPWLVPGQPGFR